MPAEPGLGKQRQLEGRAMGEEMGAGGQLAASTVENGRGDVKT